MRQHTERPLRQPWLAWALGLMLMNSVALAAPAPPREVTPAKLATALSQLDALTAQAMKTTGVPGVAVVVVHDDRIVYLKGFGVREVGRPGAITPDTVFQLASMSKPISATVVAALVGDGRVAWDDAVADHLPEFRLKDPWVTRQVTARDLFSHRSGLPGGAGDDLEGMGYDRSEILHRLRFLEPASSLRSAYAYSNFGLTAGAEAAARAAGKSWEALSTERLFQPLGMNSTTSRYADYAAADNRARLHVRIKGQWVAGFTRQPDAQAPAGGISSTARDLAQWMRLELGGGMLGSQRIIDAGALAQTHLPVIMRGMDLVTARPSFYGLGWGVDSDVQGRVYWTHAGAFSTGARTYVSLLPAENLGITVLANAFPTGLPDGVAASFYDLALNGKLTQD